MKPPEITIHQILAWRPCNMAPGEKYSRDGLRSLFGGRDSITPLEVCDLPISAVDRLWVLLHVEVLGEKTLRLLAADFAEHVLPFYESKYPGDLRPRKAIEAARAFARGEIDREALRKAHDAVIAATNDADAATYAATATCSAADTYAANGTADAGAAAYAAYATYAANDATDAERKWQIARVRGLLDGSIPSEW